MHSNRPRLRSLIAAALGLALCGAALYGLYVLLATAYHALASLERSVAVAAVAASATVLASTMTVVIGRQYQAGQDRIAAHRDKKIVLYDTFLTRLSELFAAGPEGTKNPEELVPFLREIQKNLILWSGPGAVKAYAEWQASLANRPPQAMTVIRMIDFYFALRKDLGHSNKGLGHEHLLRLILRNPDLFMREYKRNPNVPLTEIARIEKELGSGSGVPATTTRR